MAETSVLVGGGLGALPVAGGAHVLNTVTRRCPPLRWGVGQDGGSRWEQPTPLCVPRELYPPLDRDGDPVPSWREGAGSVG